MNEFTANRQFEAALCEYAGAPYAIAVDNCCNALFLCLRYMANVLPDDCRKEVTIPQHTFIGVPYAIRAAGFTPIPNLAYDQEGGYLEGAYTLQPWHIQDCALRLTSGMYQPGTLQCLSFTGPYKHLKLGKAGAILTDSKQAAEWLRRTSYCGRHYVSYHEDTFDLAEGYNNYLHPMIAALGVQLVKGLPKHNADLRLPYPDWSAHPAFKSKQDADG